MKTISYFEKGSGRPVILLHGFCETKRIWDGVASSLSENFSVIVPDLPGCGESEAAEEDFSLETIALILLEWVETLGLVRPVVIGHSMGGYVTLAMAMKAPQSFGGIGLFHSTAAPDTDEKKDSRNKVIDFVQRNGVQAYTDSFVSGLFYDKNNSVIPAVKKMAASTGAAALIGYAAAMRDRDSSLSWLKATHLPVLFVAGEHDSLIPVKQILEQSEMTRTAMFSSIKHAAHMGMQENEPESSILIADFLRFINERNDFGN